MGLTPFTMAAAFTTDELLALNTFGQVLDWAGVDGSPGDAATCRGALLTALGAGLDTQPRVFGVIPAMDFDAVVNGIQIQVTRMVDGQPVQETVPPNLTQRGAMTLTGLICRCKAGMGGQAQPVAQPASAPPLQGGPPSTALRKIKLGQVLRQADETEIEVAPETLMSTGYARWEQLHGIGSRPAPECDVTIEQLTALAHLLTSGAVPYCDFAIWGPHGHRLERKMRLSGSVFTSDGSLRNIEVAGPPTVDVWDASFMVMRTGAIMLDAIDLGVLDAYSSLIRRFHTRYGPSCWLLLYQADTRFRLEHLERVRRLVRDRHELAVTAGGTTPYDEHGIRGAGDSLPHSHG